LMVSMVIGLIVLAALAQIFATSRGAYHLEEGLARVQESGRFAMEFLAQDIRMAGFAGCNSAALTPGTISGSGAGTTCSTNFCNGALSPTAAQSFNPEGISGHRYNGSGNNDLNDWLPPLPSDYFANGQVKARSDVIIIQRGSTINTNLTGNLTPDNANVKIMNNTEIDNLIFANTILMLSDCKAGDIFRANSISSPGGSGERTITHSSGNISSFLSHKYGNDAELMLLISRAYYIGTGASGEPALMMKELVSSGTNAGTVQARELVEGIEELRVLYGEDTDPTANNITDQYRTADVVASWRRVMNVRIGMLAVTPANVDTAPDNRSYTLVPGQTLAAKSDKRRRQLFTSTVQVRNRFN
jgi:type IV pilus assembly protein PilW